jgi:hypothetical protein
MIHVKFFKIFAQDLEAEIGSSSHVSTSKKNTNHRSKREKLTDQDRDLGLHPLQRAPPESPNEPD